MRYDTDFSLLDIPNYKGPGIYALIDDLGRMYIGSSVNIQMRMRMHNTYLRFASVYGYNGFENPRLIESVLSGSKIRCKILLKTDNLNLSRDELYLLESDYIKIYSKSNELFNTKAMRSNI